MTSKISIIVPVYNSEKYLNRCIESILCQTYQNIEIILVNDGSSDNSGTICNDFERKNLNIRAIHNTQSSGSAGSPRNSGIKIASGEYIAFVDSDDWIHPEMMKIMLTALQVNKTEIVECDLIAGNEYFINSLNNYDHIETIVEDRLVALKRIITNQRFSVCVRLYKRSVIKDVTFPENVISEDVFFTLEIFNKVTKISRLEIALYYYFTTPNSVTRKVYSLKYLDTLNSGLSLQKKLLATENDQELLTTIQFFILKTAMYHYKKLNYYSHIDPNYVHRKRVKKLIDKNYVSSKAHEPYTKLAKVLSVSAFELLINLNKFRHKTFKTNHFS